MKGRVEERVDGKIKTLVRFYIHEDAEDALLICANTGNRARGTLSVDGGFRFDGGISSRFHPKKSFSRPIVSKSLV
uniref:Uncharacterized protein n=1 Tax=Parascaris equorum TaxID=6256 RepID=A0A914RAJ7_PAREQ